MKTSQKWYLVRYIGENTKHKVFTKHLNFGQIACCMFQEGDRTVDGFAMCV